jgi:putative DNA primase/helicase
MRDHSDAFRVALEADLGPSASLPDAIEAGRLHRFSTSGKRGDLSGWCRLFDDGRAGVYGCWRLGVSEVWTAAPRESMTPAERAALRQRVAQDKAQRVREQRAAWRTNFDRNAFLLRQCKPVTADDAVSRYLRRRLVVDSLVVPECIQLHPAMPYVHEGAPVGTFPAMVAPIVNSAGDVMTLHRTYLTPEGRKADVPGPVKKLTPAAGLLRGACIPLHKPARGCIGIAEGIETALAAWCASAVPTVASYCAGNLAAWRWPAGVQRLVIFADADTAGRDAAEALQGRAAAARLQCEVLTPSAHGADWCDVWAAGGAVLVETAGAA